MKAVVIRKGQDCQKGPRKYHHIAIVECDKCDAKYIISQSENEKEIWRLLPNKRES
jgi:hypothetical protein